ncbi:MAG: IS3 family transposase [Leptospiraceae bacterium]|nr:IS3 family transposase [Leptospiraceae bacterium]
MTQSMSRKGNALDNAPAENFFKTLKVERVYHSIYNSIKEARSDLFYFIEIFYNRKRLHSKLNFTSPVDFKKMYYKRTA